MKFLALLLLIISVPARAGTFTCQDDPRSTIAAITVRSDLVQIHVGNPSGFSQMPLFEAPLSQGMIPFLKMQAEDLQGLGEEFYFNWPAASCEIGDGFLLRCGGEATPLQNSVQGWGLSTFQVTEKGLDGAQEGFKARLVLQSLQSMNTYFVTLPFSTRFCSGRSR